MTKKQKEAAAAAAKVQESTVESSGPVIEESGVEVQPVEAPAKGFPIEKPKSQAELDLAILIQAQKIRVNADRFMAVKAIAGAAKI